MPEKDFNLLQNLAAAIVTGGVAWLSIFKFMAQGKDNALFKQEVSETVNTLKIEVKSLSAEVFTHKSLARTLIETMETNTRKIESIDKYITDERTEKMRSQAVTIIKQEEELKRLRNK